MNYTKGERVRVFGRPWGKSHAPAKWRYGTVVGTNAEGSRPGRFPVALLSDLGADYTGDAYLIAFTEQGGALWYKEDELRKVRARALVRETGRIEVTPAEYRSARKLPRFGGPNAHS